MMRVSLILILIFSLTCLITGCGSNNELKQLKKEMAEIVKIDPINLKTITLKPLQLPTVATYQAANMHAPFAGENSLSALSGKSSNPLESYPLTSLRFVGTIVKPDRILAIIQTPDNIVFEVKKGDNLGDNYGKVISIFPNKLNVMELGVEKGKPTVQRILTLELKDK